MSPTYLPKDATIRAKIYPVGWRMAVLIEKTYGRAKLIECMCGQRLLLPTYNRAAAKFNQKSNKPLALWSAPVVSLGETVWNSWKGIGQ